MHAPNYQHSEGFARLKRIKETIPDNLTSVEYLTTLDSLLECALAPLIINTRFLDTFLLKILAWQSGNPKRKTTSIARADLPSYITLFLITSDSEEKLSIVRKIGFNRGILFELIRRWYEIMAEYEAISSDLSLNRIEILTKRSKLLEKANVNEDGYAYGAYQQSKYWYDKAREFKAAILEKYTRLCLNTAQTDYVKLGCQVDLNDIIQIYLLTADKAIDKCDATKGVLTTHIQNWLKSAKNIVVEKYIMPEAGKQSSDTDEDITLDEIVNNRTNNYDNVSPIEDEIEKTARITRVQQLAKFFDPSGYARLVLGIKEHVTPGMLQQVQLHNQNAKHQ